MKQKHKPGGEHTMAVIALHIFTLYIFVVARPIFTLLADHPGYLVAIKIGAMDLYVAIAIIIIGIPIILVGPVAISGIFGYKFRLFSQSLVCASFVSVFVLHLVGEVEVIPFLGSVKLPAVIFVLVTFLYYKKPQFSLFITVLSPVIILFPVLFLLNDNIERVMQADESLIEDRVEIINARPGRKPPITMLIFDELPLVDLLNANGDIDARSFPNFAALAKNASWYKNATTVSNATQIAVPAILSGIRPQSRKLPVFNEYPRSVFSLLEGHYAFHVIEPITRLHRVPQTVEVQETTKLPDPRRLAGFLLDMSIVYLHIVLPQHLAVLAPAIDDQWGGFFPASLVAANQKNRVHQAMAGDRAQSLLSFIADIGSYPKETLHFIHVMLPHRPLQYLPSGHIYTTDKYIKGISITRNKLWQGEQLLLDKMHQRHRLQIAYVDALLGQLFSAMKAAGIYEDGLLIIVADHGISYQQNLPTRQPMKENFGEVAFIPLFIKYPSQTAAIEEEFNAETIDILPTIVDVLDTPVSWEFDGRSLLGEHSGQETKNLLVKTSDLLVYKKDEYLSARQTAIDRNISNFSLDDPRSDLFHYEPGLDLIGTETSTLTNSHIPCSVHSEMIADLTNVNLQNKFLPVQINGEIKCVDTDIHQALLIAGVNGVIRGVTTPYIYKDETLFSIILSDQVFRDGANELEFFVIKP